MSEFPYVIIAIRLERIIEAIRAERIRQIEAESYDSEHDSEHIHGELADMAAYYATTRQPVASTGFHDEVFCSGHVLELLWPANWDVRFAKKGSKTRERQLIVAASLIIAEIERLHVKNDLENLSKERDSDSIR